MPSSGGTGRGGRKGRTGCFGADAWNSRRRPRKGPRPYIGRRGWPACTLKYTRAGCVCACARQGGWNRQSEERHYCSEALLGTPGGGQERLYHRQVRVAGLHATGARCVRAFTKQGGWRNRCEELILRRCLEPQQADFGRQDAYPGRPRPE